MLSATPMNRSDLSSVWQLSLARSTRRSQTTADAWARTGSWYQCRRRPNSGYWTRRIPADRNHRRQYTSHLLWQLLGVVDNSTVYSGADHRKRPSFASMAFVRENSSVTDELPAQKASNAENVSIWWRHHVDAYHPSHHENRRCMNSSDRSLNSQRYANTEIRCYTGSDILTTSNTKSFGGNFTITNNSGASPLPNNWCYTAGQKSDTPSESQT